MATKRLTIHAMLRWLEHRQGVDVDGARRKLASIDECHPRDVSEVELLNFVCAELNIADFSALTAQILTLGLKAACESDARRYRSGNDVFIISDGLVITYRPAGRRHTHKAKGHRSCNKHQRRRRSING